MVVVILTCITMAVIATAVLHHRKPSSIPGTMRIDKQQLREIAFRREKSDLVREVTDREVELWSGRVSRSQLRAIRKELLNAVNQISYTDWDACLFNLILNKSSMISHYIADGKLDSAILIEREKLGIKHAVHALRDVSLKNIHTLRDYFHSICENVILRARYDDWLYLSGNCHVLNVIKSYCASRHAFTALDKKKQKKEKLKVRKGTVFDRLAVYYATMEKRRAKFKCYEDNNNIKIEFNLSRIYAAGIAGYHGSLVNCLFLEVEDRLNILTGDEAPQHRSITMPMLEATCTSYSYNGGYIYVVKHLAADDGVPDDLFVEFENLPDDDPIIRNMQMYKIYVEGNG